MFPLFYLLQSLFVISKLRLRVSLVSNQFRVVYMYGKIQLELSGFHVNPPEHSKYFSPFHILGIYGHDSAFFVQPSNKRGNIVYNFLE